MRFTLALVRYPVLTEAHIWAGEPSSAEETSARFRSLRDNTPYSILANHLGLPYRLHNSQTRYIVTSTILQAEATYELYLLEGSIKDRNISLQISTFRSV